MNSKIKMKFHLLPFLLCLLLFTARWFFPPAQQVMAAKKVDSLTQMEQLLQKQIKNGNLTIVFRAPASCTTLQIQAALERAAKSQNRLPAGSIQYFKQSGSGMGGYVKYTIKMSADSLMKIKILKTKTAAVKAAAQALKNNSYSANFYSETSYYDVFYSMLQQHPEYNYGTSVWKSTNGAYGYKRSSGMTKKQQDAKMAAADKAASAAVSSCIQPQMTDEQKARAIHDYVVKNCAYGNTADAYTAYGSLVNGTAVCQGYASAFNLMAQKCGLQSMTVCGVTRGGAHAWTYVKIGKNYSYLDCTWDDTGENGGGIIYVYFLVDADKMREDHTWNEADFPVSDIAYSKYFS